MFDEEVSLTTPAELLSEIPVPDFVRERIEGYRREIAYIIHYRDNRWLVIVGPCSIHDTCAAFEYAKRLKILSESVRDELFVVMRVYFEKPRSTLGWKGLINDPFLDESFDVESGLRKARSLLVDLGTLGVPAGCEFLDPFTPGYLCDLVSWGAIGARTTEAQTHRELAAALPFPVGFKNATSGDINVAIEGSSVASSSHVSIGVGKNGRISIIKRPGNPHTHVVLRGGKNGPNFDNEIVEEISQKTKNAIIIDCSHGNSGKSHQNQILVLNHIIQQQIDRNTRSPVQGVMIESFIHQGNQNLPKTCKDHQLKYGVSITDACVSWEETETMIHLLANALRRSKANDLSDEASTGDLSIE